MASSVRLLLAWASWPGVLAAAVAGTALGFALGQPVLCFYPTYALFMGALMLLERMLPHESRWTEADGQIAADLGHTLVSNVAVQGVLTFSGMIGFSALARRLGGSGIALWPTAWPLAAQVALGLVVLEFTLYWAHRLAHERRSLWHFHAVHHSVERLWAVNSGRFHFVDAVKSVLPGVALLTLLGAPLEVLTWLSAIGAFVGTMTHCNVAMRFGWLSLLFNTPDVHRWHHSKDLREGNKNYGETLMIWDLVFGTYFNAERRPPVDIGIAEAMPPGFLDQLVWPFRRLLARRPAAAHPEAAPAPIEVAQT